MTALCNYKLWCITDAKYETVWRTEGDLPTTCPTNTAHSIDTDSITINQMIKQNEVKILEDGYDKTAGYIAGTTRALDITGATGETQIFDYSRPITVGINSISFTTTAVHEGDEVNIIIAPNTVVGVLTANVTAGATNTFSVSPTVTANLKKGFFVSLLSGATKHSLGVCTSVNSTLGQITTEFATDGTTFLAATPTYIVQDIKMLQNWIIGPPCDRRIGDDKLGASIIPAGTVARVEYKNNNGIPKKFVLNSAILY